jgi:AraC family transcriptional regulator
MNTPFDFPLASGTERRWLPQVSVPAVSVNHTAGLARWQMKRVRLHIEMNLAQPLSIDDVARVVNLSVSHFCRAFKVSFGITVHRYVMHKRVERAQELIASTSDPLSDIAIRCGMSDQSHMTRWFRRVVGVPPARWRRALSSCPAG